MMEKLHSLNNFDPTLPISTRGLNCNSEQYFLDPISPVVSSPSPSSSVLSNNTCTLPELIGNFPLHSHPGQSNVRISLPQTTIASDPGFAERAAKHSCFRSKSFNGRTNLLSSYPLMGNEKLPRVSSNHVLELSVRKYQMEMKKLSKFSGSGANSDEVSIATEQISSKISNRVCSTKRKLVSRVKERSSTSLKELRDDEVGNPKRLNKIKSGKSENIGVKTEEEAKGGSSEKPAKDYIYVRAVRGQATDSHSLAERVRREKISERMKLLQDLVPTCNKVTGKALMLDEIINYVQSLQRQVEFLSMKLASVNPKLEFNMDNLQQNQEMYPFDSSAPALIYNHDQSQQNLQLHNPNIESRLLSNLGIELPSILGLSENLPQFHAFGGDNLHNIFQTGFGQNPIIFLGQNVRN